MMGAYQGTAHRPTNIKVDGDGEDDGVEAISLDSTGHSIGGTGFGEP